MLKSNMGLKTVVFLLVLSSTLQILICQNTSTTNSTAKPWKPFAAFFNTTEASNEKNEASLVPVVEEMRLLMNAVADEDYVLVCIKAIDVREAVLAEDEEWYEEKFFTIMRRMLTKVHKYYLWIFPEKVHNETDELIPSLNLNTWAETLANDYINSTTIDSYVTEAQDMMMEYEDIIFNGIMDTFF